MHTLSATGTQVLMAVETSLGCLGFWQIPLEIFKEGSSYVLL